MDSTWKRGFISLAVCFFLAGGCSNGTTAPAEEASLATLEILTGAVQQAPSGSLFPQALRVRAVDQFGNGLANHTFTTSVQEGSGWVVDRQPVSDASGEFFVEWYAGRTPGETAILEIRSGGVSATAQGTALNATPGNSYHGHRDLVEYIPGTLPIVITAPHGGRETPSDIPDRTWGTTVMDTNTDVLAYLLGDAFESLTGARPHLVILHLRRTKLDANRGLQEAAQGNPVAERAWFEFHHWTETALERVKADHDEGIYIDLHGHGHDFQALELGYMITTSDLNRTDEELDQAWAIDKSALRTWVDRTGLSHSELLRGPTSLGALFEAEGYPSVPSPLNPTPPGAFFSGGYNTGRHSCRDGGPICGFQLEVNQDIRFNRPWGTAQENMAAFAEAHARVIREFLQAHLGKTLGAP